MLVLSRNPGERVIVGDGIEPTIAEVNGNRVRLGITAVADVPNHRQEVDQRTDPEEAEAPGWGVGMT